MEAVMTRLVRTQTSSTGIDVATKRKRLGFFRIAAYTLAFIGAISAFTVAELSQSRFASQMKSDFVDQTELRNLLCRIDRRCPAKVQAAQNAR
jgi:hypothetical protein